MSLVQRMLAALHPARPFDSEWKAYHRLKNRGFVPGGILDVGAYEGEWTRMARGVWKDTPVLMVEPQMAKKPFLDRVCDELANSCYHQVVLSAKPNEAVTFYEMETGSSIYAENSNAERTARTLITATLDEVALGFPGKHLFLKIDVQGAELDVLAGAQETLRRVDAVQLELPIVEYNKGAPGFFEVLFAMDNLGYAPIELTNQTIMQGVLAQIDMVFMKKDSKLRDFYFKF